MGRGVPHTLGEVPGLQPNGSWLWFSPSVQDRTENEFRLGMLLVSADFCEVADSLNSNTGYSHLFPIPFLTPPLSCVVGREGPEGWECGGRSTPDAGCSVLFSDTLPPWEGLRRVGSTFGWLPFPLVDIGAWQLLLEIPTCISIGPAMLVFSYKEICNVPFLVSFQFYRTLPFLQSFLSQWKPVRQLQKRPSQRPGKNCPSAQAPHQLPRWQGRVPGDCHAPVARGCAEQESKLSSGECKEKYNGTQRSTSEREWRTPQLFLLLGEKYGGIQRWGNSQC